jgi:RNA polymerase sigma-70 factor (ECF subfamily)
LTSEHGRFESAVLPHLDAAFNLARWLTGDDGQARDAVQTGALRALNYIDNLRGEEGRSWFLAIVRNVCMDALRDRAARASDLDVVEWAEGPAGLEQLSEPASRPDELMERRATRERVNATLRSLPVVYREALVLREIEDMGYEEIAIVTGVPIGTVMSRLSRARRHFRAAFLAQEEGRAV